MEELEAKLKELETRQSMNDRCFMWVKKEHKETGDKIDEEIKALEKQIAEEAKPKLRHGDCVVFKDNGSRYIALRHSGNKLYWYSEKYGEFIDSCDTDEPSAYTIVFNIFDDLKAMQENVTEFEAVQDEGAEVTRVWYNNGYLKMEQGGSRVYIDIKANPDFILKLRQMEATMKREQAKK